MPPAELLGPCSSWKVGDAHTTERRASRSRWATRRRHRTTGTSNKWIAHFVTSWMLCIMEVVRGRLEGFLAPRAKKSGDRSSLLLSRLHTPGGSHRVEIPHPSTGNPELGHDSVPSWHAQEKSRQ